MRNDRWSKQTKCKKHPDREAVALYITADSSTPICGECWAELTDED